MCVVSMIMNHYSEKWGPTPPTVVPLPHIISPPSPPIKFPFITKEEIDEFRRLLERAREYDRRNNEPDCELEEKKRKVRELAEQLGVKIDFL